MSSRKLWGAADRGRRKSCESAQLLVIDRGFGRSPTATGGQAEGGRDPKTISARAAALLRNAYIDSVAAYVLIMPPFILTLVKATGTGYEIAGVKRPLPFRKIAKQVQR